MSLQCSIFYFPAACDIAGCQQICINDPLAGPICRCGDKYALQDDGISCKGNF